MDEKNEELINDFSSSNLGIKKKGMSLSLSKRIIIGAVSLLVILVIIILLIIFLGKSKSSKKPSDDDLAEIGIISCIYDINPDVKETKILGEEFTKTSNFYMFINGNKIKFSKVYEFTTFGYTNIEFKFYENLNISYMFKGINSLISVDMKSENDTKIISMNEAFENCENLESFSIKGFNTQELKSLKKLFYKTNLNKLQLTDFNTENVEDF